MLHRTTAARVTALALAVSFLAAGCLERRERIEVRRDGSLAVHLTLKGDPGEFRAGRADALPSGAPWSVRDRDIPRADGKGADHEREAEAVFASASAIPQSSGPADDPAPLRAATALAIERTAGGSERYTFVRRYAPRPYAWRDRAFRRAFPDDLRRALERRDDAPLSKETERRALAALVAFEREKAQDLLEQAIRSVDPLPDAEAARVLEARAALGRAIDAAWPAEKLAGLVNAPEDEKAKLDAKFHEDVAREAVAAGVRTLGAERAKALSDAFTTARRVLEATEDLQDESFELRVTFPVPVALSDGAALDDGGRTAVFRFKGEDLRDEELVLRAVAEGRP
jgi:hypothetical protein